MTTNPLHALVVLGTMYFGTRLDDRRSFEVLDRYIELGGQWIDTSNNYSFWEHESGFGGQSEAVIGRWLRANQGVAVRISTKVGAQPTHRGGFPDHLEGLQSDVVHRSLDASLERLGVDRVDLYWAHVEDASVPMRTLVETFGGLQADGRVGAYGLSNHPSWLFASAREIAKRSGVAGPVAYQQRYSYLQPAPGAPVTGQPLPLGMLSSDGLELLRREVDITGWVYTSLLLGAYDRDDRPLPDEYRHPGNVRRMKVLSEIASERGVQRGQIVLAWLSGAQPGLVPLVGCSDVDQVERAVTGVQLHLTGEERARLDAAH
ncbi:aldo/keto reductase [Microbacterium sp. HD4P20]|uniref:aldo/keto reductase n=1 Tax=Microbacterium sp. HD4P20 TaxID=2864874 RepID=UPI001C63BA6E|nr:aldo/keto reductase [Microbacterium sp. HD4P20]MCP2637405.1 aldo/keto reductase [Microbacterium sp. HD4P20]